MIALAHDLGMEVVTEGIETESDAIELYQLGSEFAQGYAFGQALSAIDARKLEAELGWKPAETFETGLRKTVRWYLDNPDWVQDVQSGSYRQWISDQYLNRASEP